MSSPIKLHFLGTSAQIPTANRNHTAILLSYNEENILVDCGEGTQRQFRKAGLNPCKITKLLITHWHGDHVLGIPGLLQTLAFSEYKKTLKIYGPKGTKRFIDEIFSIFGFKKEISVEVYEVGENFAESQKSQNSHKEHFENSSEKKENRNYSNFSKHGKFSDEEDFYLEAGRAFHGIPTNCYSFVKKGMVRIDKNKLKKMKVPQGKHLQDLKNMKDIVVEGKKYKWKELTYSDEDIKVSFILDSAYDKSFVQFAKDSNVLVCESSFDDELKEKAKEHMHMTAKQAAEIAKASKSKRLILTHISQRYEADLKKLLNESKKVFKESYIANDLDEFDVE
jgi:ribonuclease Z